MSSVITLRARLVAGCAVALVALTGCSDVATQADPMGGYHRLDLGDALGTVHYSPALHGPGTDVSPLLQTGTDAGLITTPATPEG